MLSTLKLSFCKRILVCSRHHQISTTVPNDQTNKSKKSNSGYAEFERDTKLLSSVPLRKVTASRKNSKEEQELITYIQDYNDSNIVDQIKDDPKPVKSKPKKVEVSKQTLVYKPDKSKSVPNDSVRDDLTTTGTTKTKNTKRKKIEDRLLIERELEKKRAVAKCSKVLEHYRINEEFLENMMKYPLHPEILVAENCSGNFFDEMEFKLSGEQLFSKMNTEGHLNPSLIQFPAVTTVMNIAMSDEKRKNLLKWQIDKIELLGFEGFEIYQRNIMKNGTDFHKAVETLAKKETLDELAIPNDILESVNAIKNVFEREFKGDMVLIEEKLFHNGLFYKGRLDCMGYYKDSLCLIDWKRSDKPKQKLHELYENPIQTSAYIGAFMNDPNFRELREKHKLKNALIVNVSECGEVNIHQLNYQQVEFYWYSWLHLLRTFWNNVMQQKAK